MDNICGEVNKKQLVLQSSNKNDQSVFKVPVTVPVKKKSKSNGSVDYNNIAFTMSGEISSPWINRTDLFAQRDPVSFEDKDDDDDDDDEFISNMKRIIDENGQMQHKESYNVRNLRSKSARKRKCVFSDEDLNLMKRFKRSMDEKKASRSISQKSSVIGSSVSSCATVTNSSPQVTPNVVSRSCATATNSSPQVSPNVTSSTHTNLGDIRDNQLLSYETISTMQKNDYLQTINFVTETINIATEIEQLVYSGQVQFLTPPQKNKLDE